MKTLLATLTVLGCAAAASAQTVTFDLTSAQNGQSIAPGTTVNWQIAVDVSTVDNAGLAAVITDLAQDGQNPELFNIPPAAGVPVQMTNFSRPAGISNPGETDPTTGYIGVQRGAVDAFNLVQIGGAQNGFGQALAPGSGVAENATVVAGVGQSGSIVIATGSFPAPTTAGVYSFSLANSAANVFTAVNAAPTVSPVEGAVIATTNDTFTFTVGGSGCSSACDVLGGDADVDGDCDVDLSDLAAVLANFGLTGASPADGDTDNDTDVDLTDLANVLSLFGTVCP